MVNQYRAQDNDQATPTSLQTPKFLPLNYTVLLRPLVPNQTQPNPIKPNPTNIFDYWKASPLSTAVQDTL